MMIDQLKKIRQELLHLKNGEHVIDLLTSIVTHGTIVRYDRHDADIMKQLGFNISEKSIKTRNGSFTYYEISFPGTSGTALCYTQLRTQLDPKSSS